MPRKRKFLSTSILKRGGYTSGRHGGTRGTTVGLRTAMRRPFRTSGSSFGPLRKGSKGKRRK